MRRTMPKQQIQSKPSILNIITWLTGIIVSLAVGLSLTAKTLTIPYLHTIITQIAGWIIVICSIITIISTIFSR